jgi:xanthine dehydrogenase accessory factor
MTTLAKFYERLATWSREGVSFVLVSVVATAGSSPREAGAKMAVTSEEFAGSVGGGQLEYAALKIARAMLAGGDRKPAVKTVALGPAVGQCCGGQVALLFEPQLAALARLALFGAGHVAKALVAILTNLPFRIDWIDPRAGEFPASLPANTRMMATENPVGTVAKIHSGAIALVMTHSHDLDYALVRELLARADLAYVGLIGSMSKRARFERRLRDEGFDQAALDRLTCPIGIEGIDAKDPARIAVAVAAQLLQHLSVENEESPDSAEDWARWREIEGRSR